MSRHLLTAVGAGSEIAIDALVVATAIRLGGGVIATHDPDDLRRRTPHHRHLQDLNSDNRTSPDSR